MDNWTDGELVTSPPSEGVNNLIGRSNGFRQSTRERVARARRTHRSEDEREQKGALTCLSILWSNFTVYTNHSFHNASQTSRPCRVTQILDDGQFHSYPHF